MGMHLKYILSVLLLLNSLATVVVGADPAAVEMAQTANHFLQALAPEQKAKATYPLTDPERVNWHFIPKERKGLPLKEMTQAQRHLATGLMASGLSSKGLIKATTIMSLEQILLDIEQGKGPKRDPEMYFITIFGEPKEAGTWGWRVEGHHLSLNFTVVEGQVGSVTPSFMGTNPGEVRIGTRTGLRTLAGEEIIARELAKSLTPEQRAAVIYTNTAPADIITSADRKARVLEPKGLIASKLTATQQQLLWSVMNMWGVLGQKSRRQSWPRCERLELAKSISRGLDLPKWVRAIITASKGQDGCWNTIILKTITTMSTQFGAT